MIRPKAQKRTSLVKKLIPALQGESVGPPPIWLMRQAGRYLPEYRATRVQAGSFLELCFAFLRPNVGSYRLPLQTSL